MTRLFVGMTLKSMTVSQPDSAWAVVTSLPSGKCFQDSSSSEPSFKASRYSAPSAAQKVAADAAAKPEAKPAKNGKCACDICILMFSFVGSVKEERLTGTFETVVTLPLKKSRIRVSHLASSISRSRGGWTRVTRGICRVSTFTLA